MSKGGTKSTSTTTQLFPPEATPILAAERQLLGSTLLPMEQQRLLALGALGRGQYGAAQPLVGPALSAARQAQARLSASSQELPGTIAAPLQEGLSRQVEGIPQQLQTMAPDELASMVQALIGPQFGGLFAPGQQTMGRGAGPSGLQTGMSAASTAAVLGMLAATIFSSRRLKEALMPFLGGLSEVLALHPMAFHYRAGTPLADGREYLGFVAEEAAAIDPRLALYDDQGQPFTLNIHAFLALLVGAVQHLVREVDDLGRLLKDRTGGAHG